MKQRSPRSRPNPKSPRKKEWWRHQVFVLYCMMGAVAFFLTSQATAEISGTGAAQQAVQPTGVVVTGVIDDEIGFATSAYVTRLLDEARSKKASALLLEINTFGGRVDAAVAIRDALLDADVTTIAFINRRAISAGALISLSCDKIAIAPGGTIGAATPIQISPGSQEAQPVAEKYVSYFRQEMRSTAEVKGRNGDIAEAMVDADKEVPGISEKGKLLTLSTEGALKYKIADIEADTKEEVLSKLKISASTEPVERTWSEELVGFLTSQAVSSLLFMAMIVLGYMEYQAPGFGFFGYSAIACFLLLFGSHYLVNLAGWEELLLFGAGVILLMIELFVTPGFGIIGALGIVCVFISAVLVLMAGDLEDFHLSNPFTLEAAFRVLYSTALSIGVLLLLIRYLPKEGTEGSRLILGTSETVDAGYVSYSHPAGSESGLVGAEGEALTPLRPSGKARIGGERINVETEGEFLDKGERLRVIRLESGRVVVRKA